MEPTEPDTRVDTSQPYPTVTTDQLRFSIPETTAKWRCERLRDNHWRVVSFNIEGTKFKVFELDDLSVEEIRRRWGSGDYRLTLTNERGRKRGVGQPFHVPKGATPDDEEPSDVDAPNALDRPPRADRRPRQANGSNGATNGNGSGVRPILAGTPVGQGTPPLVAMHAPDWLKARSLDPLQMFQAMEQVSERRATAAAAALAMQLADHREHEARRSAEYTKLLELRETQINRDADVRIASAQASANVDIKRAEQMSDELSSVRAMLLDATANAGATLDPETRAVLDDVVHRLDEISDDEEGEAPNMTAQVVGTVVQELIPVLRDLVASRLKGGASATVETTIETATGSGMADALGAAVEAAGDGATD